MYFGLILAHDNKHRTWMGIDIHLPIGSLDDFWSALASTLISNEPTQAVNHSWHAWIRVVLNAIRVRVTMGATTFHTPILVLILILILRLRLVQICTNPGTDTDTADDDDGDGDG